jgi:F420-dependent oxidoreductase-like protein
MSLELALMIEGQNGLTWESWQRIAVAAEDLGFAGLYRSDHFTNASPPDLASLELWASLTWVASHTRRIEFGPLVTPFSFRHPAFTARSAAAVDDLSDGRLVLGLGAGWQEREHAKFGFALLSPKERFDRFEEGIQVVSRLLQSDQPVDFSGKYFQLREAILLPRPIRPGGPPILVGGSGRKRTLALAARYGRYWNTGMLPPDRFSDLNQQLDGLLLAGGRQPAEVQRTMMVGCIFGRTDEQVRRQVEERTRGQRSVRELIERGVIVGTPGEMIDQLGRLSEAGAQQVMLQWLDLEDFNGLDAIASDVISQLAQ